MTNAFTKAADAIANPKKDFLFADDLFKSQKTARTVRERVFSELVEHLRRWKSYELTRCRMEKDGKRALLRLERDGKTSGFVIEFELEFDHDVIGLWHGDEHIMDSNVYGANVNRESGAVTNIKVDLASIKNKIRELSSRQRADPDVK